MPLSGTMQDRAYEMLRNFILNFVLEPGKSITIQDMANQMEVSRTPVREALIRLQKDALVRFTPQRDTLITRIDLERVRQERFMRENLELAVAVLFMRTEAQEAQLHLDTLITRQKLAAEKGDAVELIRYDDEFHSVLYHAVGQALTWEMLEQYNTHYRRVRLLNMRNSDMMRLVAEHQELLQALRSGSEEAAKRVTRQHLHHLDSEIEGLRRQYPNYFVSEDQRYNLFKLV